MRVVADSGALYALYDRDDANHRQVAQTLKQLKCALIVPSTILSELDYLLRGFLGVDAELTFLDALLSGHYTLESVNDNDLRRSRDLIKTYRDLDLGLADASVVAIAERLNVQHLLTVDLRHFRAIKPRKGTFILLPADL